MKQSGGYLALAEPCFVQISQDKSKWLETESQSIGNDPKSTKIYFIMHLFIFPSALCKLRERNGEAKTGSRWAVIKAGVQAESSYQELTSDSRHVGTNSKGLGGGTGSI